MTWQDIGIDILVVSLARSSDRRRRLLERSAGLGIQLDFLTAIDGQDKAALASAFTCNDQHPNHVYEHRAHPVSDAELACSLSHLMAILQASMKQGRYTLICEDDVDFNDVSADEFRHILDGPPDNAGHLQLCVAPGRTVEKLSDHVIAAGDPYVKRSKTHQNRLCDPVFERCPAHCATAYVVTDAGAQCLVEQCFDGNRIVLPCSAQTLSTNAGLLADRLVYRMSQSHCLQGYVYAIPTLTYEARDSLLHPDHLEGHREAKAVALGQRCRLRRHTTHP